MFGLHTQRFPARNWGAMQSQAELIAFLDADDEY